MDHKFQDSLVRLDSNSNEFCISECVKKLKDTLNEKENICLNECLTSYATAFKLALETEFKKE